ncbi:CTU2 family protein [Megaselia abdita]
MCSIGEDDFGDEGGLHAMVKDVQISPIQAETEICKKCDSSNKATVKLMFRDQECTDCFLVYARHKFRATLGSSKILPKDSEVLLIFDGSSEALVLLDMLHYAQSQNKFKRLHCSTKILYIDESSINKKTCNLKEIKSFLNSYDFPAFAINIASKSLECHELQSFSSTNDGNSEWVENYTALKSTTTRKDLLEVHRKKLIESVTKQLKCGFVFFPQISTQLASTLLTNVALGRGASVASDVALVDNRFPGIKIVRPLKDLNQEEVDVYLKVRGLKTLCPEFSESSKETSIQSITKSFVNGLQKDYSSTVSTIFRTGGKIASKDSSKLCSYCKSPLDIEESETLLATEFSRIVSENANQDEVTESVNKLEKLALQGLHDGDLAHLCHGCRNIHRDFPLEFLL